MVTKIFIFGRLGSGKSTASKFIIELTKKAGLDCIRCEDSHILYSLFFSGKYNSYFSKILKDGKLYSFNVTNPRIYDIITPEFEHEVICQIKGLKRTIVIVEFARPDYDRAFRLFSYDFLQDAYFIFIDADGEQCFQRIKERSSSVKQIAVNDNQYISEKNVKIMFGKDNLSYILTKFKLDYRIPDENILPIINNGNISQFKEKIYGCTQPLIAQHLKTDNHPRFDSA